MASACCFNFQALRHGVKEIKETTEPERRERKHNRAIFQFKKREISSDALNFCLFFFPIKKAGGLGMSRKDTKRTGTPARSPGSRAWSERRARGGSIVHTSRAFPFGPRADFLLDLLIREVIQKERDGLLLQRGPGQPRVNARHLEMKTPTEKLIPN